MSRALNLLSNTIQGYGPSDSSCLPCLGVSGRASMSPCPTRSECKALQVKIVSPNCSLRQLSFVCKASSGGQRRNPDFSRQNRHGFSRNRHRQNEERDNSENLDESEFLSTKNGPLLSLSNSPRYQPTASPGPREREIVELFRKVQAQLRERAAIKEEKKFEAMKGQNKENETVDSLLKLLRKHSVEQGKRKVNGGSGNEFNFERPRQNEQSNEDKRRSFINSDSIVREEPQETNRPSFSRPPSNFRRRSPVPRFRYEPIVSAEDTANSVSHLDIDETTDKSRSKAEPEPEPKPEPEPEPEPAFYSEPDMDMEMVSGLEMEQEEELEIESDPETDLVEGQVDGELDQFDAKDDEKQHTELKDLNAMKLAELRELAKARGMKGFSKLKKSELVGLLSEDSM